MNRYSYLFFLLLIVCKGFSQEFSVEFIPEFNTNILEKNEWYITSKGDSIQITKVQFYISDVRWGLADEKQPVKDSIYWLVNGFEESSCKKKFIHRSIQPMESLEFSFGLAGDLSENGALGGDLDAIHGMYWTWQTGYINLKIEGRSPSCSTRKNKFSYHIGGYQKPFETLRKLRFPILRGQESNTIQIKVDIAAFIEQVDLKAHPQVMIPGEEASKLATAALAMFRLKQ